MRLRPRHLTNLLPDESDLVVMDRRGVSRCRPVQKASDSSEQTKPQTEEAAPLADPRNLVGWLCERLHPLQESRLEEAIAFAMRAEGAHGRDEAWPHGLADQLIEMRDRLATHQQREQAVVFPMLLQGVDALPDRTIDEMIAAHEDLMARWGKLEHLTGGFKAPAHVCTAWRLLYVLCDKLSADCREQVDLENRMLLAGRTTGIRDDTEVLVAHAQRPAISLFLEDGHDAKRFAPSISKGLGRCLRNFSRSL